MADSIYIKLAKLREAMSKETFNNFDDLVRATDRKAKSLKVLLLYCCYDNTGKLTLVNVESVGDNIIFTVPIEHIGIKNAKEQLYEMALNFGHIQPTITPTEYVNLLECMKRLGVEEKSILTRYSLSSLALMPKDVYKKCITAFENMKKETKQGG